VIRTSTAWTKFFPVPRYTKTGDLIRPCYNSNYGNRIRRPTFILRPLKRLSGERGAPCESRGRSTWWRRLALFEDDPNLTERVPR